MPFYTGTKGTFREVFALVPTVPLWHKNTTPGVTHYMSDLIFYQYLIDNSVPQWTFFPNGDMEFVVPLGPVFYEAAVSFYYG